MFASPVLSVMSVNGFPLIIMSAHAQCSICTCPVEGIPSLVCLHMLIVGPSLNITTCLQCSHCILMRQRPTLSMCRHTNEGIPSTEHVQMLHWECADIIMRGNPLTDNTEDANKLTAVTFSGGSNRVARDARQVRNFFNYHVVYSKNFMK